jgi:hypothetical protein
MQDFKMTEDRPDTASNATDPLSHVHTTDAAPFIQWHSRAAAEIAAQAIGWPKTSVHEIKVSNFRWRRWVLAAPTGWVTRVGYKDALARRA